MMKKIIAVISLFVFMSASAVSADPQDATLLQILSRPREFDRQWIRVVGYLHLERDGDAIYLHEEDFKHGVFGNSLALEITDDMFNRREELTGKYVVLEGRFDAQSRGPFEVYSGTVRLISRCEIWSTEDMPADRERFRRAEKTDTPKW